MYNFHRGCGMRGLSRSGTLMEPGGARLLGVFAAIASAALSSVAWLTEGRAVQGLSWLVVAGLSPIIAALILGGYLRLRVALPTFTRIRPHLTTLMLLVVLRGIVGLAIFTYALSLTSGSKVMFLTKVEPYLVLFLGWFSGRGQTTLLQVLLLGVHVFGAMLLSTGGEVAIGSVQLGDALVVLGILVMAITYAPATKLSGAIGATQLTFLINLFGGLVLFPCAVLFHWEHFAWTESTRQGWGNLFLTVFIFYIASTGLWYFALTHVEGWLVSALRCLGPLVAFPIAWFLLGETLEPGQLVGAALVLVTSLLLVWKR